MLDITVTGQALVQTPISVGPATATVGKFLAASHLGFTNLEVAGEEQMKLSAGDEPISSIEFRPAVGAKG